MPLTPNFSVSQPTGEPSVVTLEDTSTGSDGAISQRRAYLRTSAGVFLVEEGVATEYTPWSYANPTIDIDALDKDYGLYITVEWLDVSNTVLYSKSTLVGLTSFNEDFDYQLTQLLSGNPLLWNDADFWQNKSNLRTEIDSGDQAISRAADIFGAQQCYDRATRLRETSQYSFNGNS